MNILSIGGSDPSSGAGVQADARLFARMNADCQSVITAITAQNTSSFQMIRPLPARMVKEQLDSVLADFEIDAVKIGIVYNSQIIKLLYGRLGRIKAPIIIDPVIRSTTRGMLIEESALDDFRRYMVRMATVITPNVFEAGTISGTRTAARMAEKIQGMGAQNVIITGIRHKGMVRDFILEKGRGYFISAKAAGAQNRGSGNIHSGMVAFALAGGCTIRQAAVLANKESINAIRGAKKTGRGMPVADTDAHKTELAAQIDRFINTRGISDIIPECQTNFVYGAGRPRSASDVLGIRGRIVRAGSSAILAGDIQYGGSKHVAAALLAANKRFPKVNAALNIRYQRETIKKIKGRFKVAAYDRRQEPPGTKSGGSSIKWGVESATRGMKECPDAIFHDGDFGKEPMIIMFGTNPRDVMDKIARIL